MKHRLASLVAAATLALAHPAGAAVEVWASARVTLGLGVSAVSQRAMAFAPGLSAGVKLFFPTNRDRAWVLNPDLGVAWTRGYAFGDSTLGAAGVGVGHQWGATALSWQPRALYGARCDGAEVWGVRNGLRVGLVAGLLDVEVSHQFLRAPDGDAHEVLITVGADFGQLAHLLARLGPRPRPAPAPQRPSTPLQIAR
jgi:hypothetical protein